MANEPITMTLPNTVVREVASGASGGTTFIFDQAIPADEWNIIHDLARFPSVTVVDSAGTVVYGSVNYVSKNEITLRFTAPFSGVAYLN